MKIKGLAAILFFGLCGVASAQTTAGHVDWRSSGAVTPVRDQGSCGSDYAFATVAALEGAHKLATGHLLRLSEQELVDCSNVYGNHGCNGGGAEPALRWVLQHGIAANGDYPYTARSGACRSTTRPAVHITGLRNVGTDLTSLTEAVAKQPVAVLIDASGSFEHYEGGIYACHAGSGNHWVTIVGYGTTATGQSYWIIKNSHGTTWGESGYMRLTRTADCKNIFAAVVPTVQ